MFAVTALCCNVVSPGAMHTIDLTFTGELAARRAAGLKMSSGPVTSVCLPFTLRLTDVPMAGFVIAE